MINSIPKPTFLSFTTNFAPHFVQFNTQIHSFLNRHNSALTNAQNFSNITNVASVNGHFDNPFFLSGLASLFREYTRKTFPQFLYLHLGVPYTIFTTFSLWQCMACILFCFYHFYHQILLYRLSLLFATILVHYL